MRVQMLRDTDVVAKNGATLRFVRNEVYWLDEELGELMEPFIKGGRPPFKVLENEKEVKAPVGESAPKKVPVKKSKK